MKTTLSLVVAAFAFFAVQVAAADPGGVVLRSLTPSAGPLAGANADDARQLFEMCCRARGRAGYSHCMEYGVCVDRPDAVCVGRGPAEGMRMDCGPVPDRAPEDDTEDGRPDSRAPAGG